MNSGLLPCDGCGQAAASEHLTRRFKRLELTTRYRPVHIQTVFLSDVSPEREEEFLYSGPEGGVAGEGRALLKAVGIETTGKSPEAVLTEFQRRGYFLAHVLECPLEADSWETAEQLLVKRLPGIVTRLKRSLKPKRVVLLSKRLEPLVGQLSGSGIEAEFATYSST